jgi:hypothetical protein
MKSYEIQYIRTVQAKGLIQAENEDDARKIFKELTGKQDRVILEGTPLNNRVTEITERGE